MPEKNPLVRERIVLEAISNNPNLHHNALVDLIVPTHMAKTTFEKTRDKLVEKSILSVSSKGNKKIYKISENYSKKSLQLTERITNENYHELHHQLKKFEDDFYHKDVNEKISSAIHLLRDLIRTDNGFTILDSIKNPKKTLYKDEHLFIQQMISKIFKLIVKDKNSDIIFSIVICSAQRNLENTL